MRTFNHGWPDSWAVIDGEPYIIGEHEITTERETEGIGAGRRTTSVSISGSATLFGKEMPSVFNTDNTPKPKTLKIIDNNRRLLFENSMFTSFEQLTQYNNVGLAVEWISQTKDVQKI